MNAKLLALTFIVALSIVSVGSDVVRAESVEAMDSCFLSEHAISIYGQRVCPDKFNEGDQFARWNEMRSNLKDVLPAAFGEEVKDSPALCEHVRTLMNKYSETSEIYLFKLQSSLLAGAQNNEKLSNFVERYKADESQYEEDAPADLVILKILSSEDKAVRDELLSYFSEAAQMKVLMVDDFVKKTQYLGTLHDSVLDTCPVYAKEKGYYKVINYNGPDAGYRVEDDPGWKELEKKWAEDKAKEETQKK